MNALLSLVTGVVRAWVMVYTHGLPAELRAERREEIDCDLWEHRRLVELGRLTVMGGAAQMFFRFIFGIPEDLMWRVDVGASVAKGRTSVNESRTMRGLLIAGLAIATLVPVMSIAILIRNWPGSLGDALEIPLWTVGPFAGGIAIAWGLMAAPSQPRRGVTVVAIGSLLVAVFWFWLFMFTVPIGIGLTTLAYFRGRSQGSWPRAAGAA